MATSSTISIDVVCPQNRDLAFVPANTVLRSEYRLSEVSGTRNIPAILAHIGGTLPGYRIEVDMKAGVGRLIDLMHDPENKHIDDKLHTAINTEQIRDHGFQTDFTDYSKQPVREYPLGEPDEAPHNAATWLYWMRRIMDTGRGRAKDGTVPAMETIREMGTIYIAPSRGLEPKPGKTPHNFLYPPEAKPAKVGGAS